MAGVRSQLRTLDRALFVTVARHHDAVLDAFAPRVTTSANHGVLWYAVSAAMTATGPTGRQAARAGLISMGLASAVANGPAKWIARRPRPDLGPVPPLRRLRRQPRTTSFPSGHSATAAGFAAAVAMESPALAVPVVALAAGVAYGRVHIGVHYPSDVAAGIALGVASAVIVRRLRRPRQVRPDAAH